MQEISQKARQVLEYLTQRESSIPPTVREIGAALQIKSTSTVHKYLTELATAGYIEKGDKMNRAISLPQQQSAKVPLLGVVTAGQPILAVEDIEGYVPYQGGRYPANELFALRVRGESMIEVGILSGDIIIVHRTPAAQNGEIVVALVEDEATVKRFYKENGHYRLQPERLDVSRFAREIALTFYQQFEERGLAVQLTDISAEAMFICADTGAMERIFSNMFQNALRYAKSYFCLRVFRDGGKICLSFENDTDALRAEDVEHLFERFYMTQKSRTTEGSGLGLTISKLLAEAMGGSAEASLEQGVLRIRYCFEEV